MELHDDAHRLILTIINYQFRHGCALQDKWDANWLIVHGDVTTPEGHWQFYNPCLLTWEAVELTDWIEYIAMQRATVDSVNFTEPNLCFLYRNGTDGYSRLVVQFSQESLPQWVQTADTYDVEFTVSNGLLQVAAESLREELRRFPPRQAIP